MLGWIAETTLVAAGIALVALLASRLLSIGPTVRHALWLVVLIKLITPPLVSWPWAARWHALDWPVSSSQAEPATSGKALVHADRPPSVRWHTELTCDTASDTAITEEIEPGPIIVDNISARVWVVGPDVSVTVEEMEMKFGPGSEFEKAMSTLADEVKEKFGPGSEFVKNVKKQAAASVDARVSDKPTSQTQSKTGKAKAAVEPQNRQRERRIRELEAQIEKLVDEIKALKSDDTPEKNDEE